MDEGLFKWAFTGVVSLLTLMFAAITKRLFAKQDELEKSKAGKESTDQRFAQTLARFDAHLQSCDHKNEQYSAKLDQLIEQQNRTRTDVAVALTKLDAIGKQQQA